MTISLALCAQLAIAAAVGVGLVAACRWLRRRSRLCGWLVVAGLLLRATVTLGLFWTSYLNLPTLRHLHSGNGFWKLAVDGPLYYFAAVDAAQHGLATVLPGRSGQPLGLFASSAMCTLGLNSTADHRSSSASVS